MEKLGTLTYGEADAFQYVTVKESLGWEHSIHGGKINFIGSMWTREQVFWVILFLSGKLENCCYK